MMNDQKPNLISISDQILDKLFSSLKNQDGFDDKLIERLRELAQREELTKTVKVADALGTTQG